MPSDDVKAKFEQAKALINTKDYAAARAVLWTVDHPKAKEWLEKLDKIAPMPSQAPMQQQVMPAPPPKRYALPLPVTLIILAAVAALGVLLASAVIGSNERSAQVIAELDARIHLAATCQGRTDYGAEVCRQWAELTVDQYPEIIRVCADQFDPSERSLRFEECLVDEGIALFWTPR